MWFLHLVALRCTLLGEWGAQLSLCPALWCAAGRRLGCVIPELAGMQGPVLTVVGTCAGAQPAVQGGRLRQAAGVQLPGRAPAPVLPAAQGGKYGGRPQ